MSKLLLFALAPIVMLAVDAHLETGRDIAQKSQLSLYSYKTLTVSGEMTLRRGTGVMGQRTIFVEQVEQPSPEVYDQARITISAPSALKDTRLLSWSRVKGDDQQWLITPRTGRVQRIAERGRQAAFVSSDFSYEDILKWQLDAYEYVRRGQQQCPAGACTVVDAKPRNRFSNYSLLKLYFDERYRISKIEYFVYGAEKPRKTLIQSGYITCGETWQPSRSVITDHERDTSTEIVWSRYQLNAPIDERIMSPNTVRP
jgi:hypothetical protein